MSEQTIKVNGITIFTEGFGNVSDPEILARGMKKVIMKIIAFPLHIYIRCTNVYVS